MTENGSHELESLANHIAKIAASLRLSSRKHHVTLLTDPQLEDPSDPSIDDSQPVKDDALVIKHKATGPIDDPIDGPIEPEKQEVDAKFAENAIFPGLDVLKLPNGTFPKESIELTVEYFK